MADLLTFLESKGFVRRRDGKPARGLGSSPQSSPPANVRYHFTSIPETAARRLFGPTPARLYLLVIAVAFLLVVREPALIPDGRSFYFPE